MKKKHPKQFRIFLMLLLYFSTTGAFADDDRNDAYLLDDGKLHPIFCDPKYLTDGAHNAVFSKLKNAEYFATPSIYIRGFNFSSDSQTLGIATLPKLGTELNFAAKIENEILKIDEIRRLKYDADIIKIYTTVFDNCLIDGDDEYSKKYKICSAKASNNVETSYGSDILELRCFMEVKGTEFPVIAKTECHFFYGTKLRSFDQNRISEEFLDYFDADIAKKSVVQLFTKYARVMAEKIPISKRECGAL